jgi:acyl-CoA thioester hydrolase
MDAIGHVNNSVYQNYLEQAAIEHSEHLGLTLELYRELSGVFVMRRVEIDYLRPAVAGDRLDITPGYNKCVEPVRLDTTKFANMATKT